jgi:hypothetical protein
MDVSREITKRLADPWFEKMKWTMTTLSSPQQLAIRDMRAFLLAARDEVFSPQGYDDRRGKLEQWTCSLSQAFMGQSHSDAAAAIAESANRFDVPRAFFYETLSAIESNLFRERLVNANDLMRLAYRQNAMFLLSAAKVAGLYEPGNRDYFLCLGIGTGLLDVITDWAHWERTDWLPIPQDWVKDVRGGESAVYQADWQKPLRINSRVRQTLLPSLLRRMATMGIESLAQATPPASVQASAWSNDLQQWTNRSIDELHTIFETPNKYL